MAIRPETLETPERGRALDTRPFAERPEPEPETGRRGPAAELRAMREKIAAMRKTPPPDANPHCKDCWLRAVRATLDAIEG